MNKNGPVIVAMLGAYKKAPRVIQRLIAGAYKLSPGQLANDIPINLRVGEGFTLPHAVGIVIDADTTIGDRVSILQNVTIGKRAPGEAAPTLCDGVAIGAGAVIIGDITLGEGCAVGANAVVTKSVPPGYVAVGVPAVNRPRQS